MQFDLNSILLLSLNALLGAHIAQMRGFAKRIEKCEGRLDAHVENWKLHRVS